MLLNTSIGNNRSMAISVSHFNYCQFRQRQWQPQLKTETLSTDSSFFDKCVSPCSYLLPPPTYDTFHKPICNHPLYLCVLHLWIQPIIDQNSLEKYSIYNTHFFLAILPPSIQHTNYLQSIYTVLRIISNRDYLKYMGVGDVRTLYANTISFFYKRLEHMHSLVSKECPGINTPQIAKDNFFT